jgi:hypothetical protein
MERAEYSPISGGAPLAIWNVPVVWVYKRFVPDSHDGDPVGVGGLLRWLSLLSH